MFQISAKINFKIKYEGFSNRPCAEHNEEQQESGLMRVKIPRDRRTLCRWIESHFHACINFYDVALLEWGYTFFRFQA